MKEIQLSKGMVALVDNEDYEWLSKFKWHARETHKLFYAVRYKPVNVGVLMHREILGLIEDPKIHVDHKDSNGLNNQKSNLRHSNPSKNSMHSRLRRTSQSGFKGVSKLRYGTHEARIRVGQKDINLGSFKDPKEAARTNERLGLLDVKRVRGQK